MLHISLWNEMVDKYDSINDKHNEDQKIFV